ncbi:MAG: RDD family protein [Neisseria sp.]|nr:RDD family protein [Neisseria sp.]
MNELNINGMQLPTEEVVDVEPASPWRRIGAYLWNVILSTLACLPLVGAVVSSLPGDYGARAQGMEDVEALAATDWSMPWLIGGALVILAYTALQLWWMARDGQSVGKKIMRIRVLRTDGRNPGFWGTVIMREMVYNILVMVVATVAGFLAILLTGSPEDAADNIANLVSMLFTLACLVMLFNRNKDRRTLQDYLANTVVVQLPKR